MAVVPRHKVPMSGGGCWSVVVQVVGGGQVDGMALRVRSKHHHELRQPRYAQAQIKQRLNTVNGSSYNNATSFEMLMKSYS